MWCNLQVKFLPGEELQASFDYSYFYIFICQISYAFEKLGSYLVSEAKFKVIVAMR